MWPLRASKRAVATGKPRRISDDGPQKQIKFDSVMATGGGKSDRDNMSIADR